MKGIRLSALVVSLSVIISLTTGIIFASGTVDQSNPVTGGGSQILAHMPIGQEFTPSQPILSAVDIAFRGGEGEADTITVNIRKGTITSPVLATLSQVVAPCPFISSPFTCIVHFDLPAPLSVTPGDKYVLELQATKPFHAWQTDAGAGDYVGGAAILQGVVDPALDFGFQTYAQTPTNLLDNFNRRNGGLATSSTPWYGPEGLGGYQIINQQVDVLGGGPIYWQTPSYGVNQEAYITLVTPDPTGGEQDLLLKVQGSNPDWHKGAIEVLYDAQAHAIHVETFRPGSSWTAYAGTPVTFQNGDQLRAQVFANGEVRIYRNSTLITAMTLNTADKTFFNSKGGWIGLWFINAQNALLDNFGGGNFAP
jgi:hypothetical protein